ncbi:sensor histidine kinase [Microlunatus capsulatus]|uniref:histidine kinase n=1 Tax=Microlunatus capsulatus TaxID=99117 RepID=A0ABS4Z4F2_9ACTN|nr:HAMP domain-containing sensor histidine kinase [Microlunatus capsulatus]MBP2415915.1 signal transduction histidine kinase [Microlunatus capsulatus]
MNPTTRVSASLAGAVLVGALVAAGYGPLDATLGQLREACLADAGGGVPGGWCSTLVRYPNRLPVLVLLAVLAAVAALGLLVARWCLRPVGELVGVVQRLGPANLGHRLDWGRRRDSLGRLGRALDALMDRISTGYDNQRRFAANASHELRTPLAVQRTLIEVSLAEPLTGDQLDLLTRQLLATNERNERLVEGLLVLAEAEQVPIGHAPLRLDEVAASVVEAFGERAAAHGVTLTLSAAPTTVDGERVLVERLVTNLVQNAVLYNLPQDGRVEVHVGDGAVTVANTGPQVPAEDVDALFEPFRRGRGQRLDQSDGAGLGLTITRAIAAAHHATTSAGRGLDGGLRIRVTFPVHRPEAGPAS